MNKPKPTKYLSKVDQEEIKARLQFIMDNYDISPAVLLNIMTKMFKPDSFAAFRLPKDWQMKSCLPNEMMKFISSMPDIESYRACDLRDLVIEKFPNSGIEPARIYSTCHYFVNRDRYMAYQQKWNEEHPERRKEIAHKSNSRRATVYKAYREQQKGESNG